MYYDSSSMLQHTESSYPGKGKEKEKKMPKDLTLLGNVS